MTAPTPASDAGRAGRALELRKAGVGYEVIAEQLKFTDADEARAAVASILAEALADEEREAELLERLLIDGMLTGLYAKARAGDSKAIAQSLRLLEQKRRLKLGGAPDGSEGGEGNDGDG